MYIIFSQVENKALTALYSHGTGNMWWFMYSAVSGELHGTSYTLSSNSRQFFMTRST